MNHRTGAALAAALLLGCHPDPVSPPQLGGLSLAVGQSRSVYIVQLTDKANPDAVAASVGAQPRYVYRYAIKGFSAALSDAAVEALWRNPLVENIEPNAVMWAAETWGLDRVDQRDLPLSNSYNPPNSGAGVTAYVIDSGIWITNVDFGGRASYGVDLTPFGGPNLGTNLDCNGHGTHVAGTIGGSQYGIAKAVALVAVRVFDCFGSATIEQVIAGVDWVTANAVRPAIANMSIQGPYTQILNDAVAGSIAAGISYAIAAGNSQGDACTYSPSSIQEAVVVGATDRLDQRAWFSNWGTCLDLFAPGVDITSDWNGQDMWTVFACGNSCTNTISGTSMATPHVAGALALVLSSNPTWTPAQVRDAVVGAATLDRIVNAGSGSPNRLLYVDWLNQSPPIPPPPPTDNASFSKSCGVDGNPFRCAFTAVSDGSWSVNGSSFGTGLTFTHTFAPRGNYTVTHTVGSASVSAVVQCNPKRCR